MALSKSSIDTLLAGLDPVPSINAISAGTAGEANPADRATYLRAAYTALAGDHASLDGRPRLEVLVASNIVRALKGRNENTISPDRVHVMSLMPSAFISRDTLTDYVEGLLAASDARSHEVKRLARELVGELTSDGSTTLTAADARGGIAFIPGALDPTAASDAEGEKAVGIV